MALRPFIFATLSSTTESLYPPDKVPAYLIQDRCVIAQQCSTQIREHSVYPLALIHNLKDGSQDIG